MVTCIRKHCQWQCYIVDLLVHGNFSRVAIYRQRLRHYCKVGLSVCTAPPAHIWQQLISKIIIQAEAGFCLIPTTLFSQNRWRLISVFVCVVRGRRRTFLFVDRETIVDNGQAAGPSVSCLRLDGLGGQHIRLRYDQVAKVLIYVSPISLLI